MSQFAKIEENIFGTNKFKRHGNEAQYIGEVQDMTQLCEADPHSKHFQNMPF
jgi:hypothetical protein